MAAGPLRHRLTIQSRTRTQDAAGQAVDSWSDTMTVWGSVEPLRGTEAQAAAQIAADLTHKVVIRGRDVSVDQRIKFGSRILEIVESRSLAERGIWREMLCKEML